MILKISFKKKELIIESSNGVFIKNFDLDIAQAVSHTDKIFVRLKLMQGDTENKNVFCLNEEGKILWQIKDPDEYNPYIKKSDSPFTDIRITSDNKIIVHNWNSNIYEVDITTGNLTMAGWTK